MKNHDVVQGVKEKHKFQLMERANVVGVGVGYKDISGKRTDELSVVVLVRQKLPVVALPASSVIPKEIDGVRTDVVQVGELRAQQARTDRWRPAPPGVSIGHYLITAGTFGAVVRDRATNERLILSNNHVLANSNDATVGDAILQPGTADGGTPANDTIATLARFCPIEFNTGPGTCSLASAYASLGNFLAGLAGSSHRVEVVKINQAATNLVDAALARPLDDSQIVDEILEIGTVSGTASAYLGMPVRKSGRTTEFTTGEITVVNSTVTVSYGIGRTATFENQIVTTAMSQGGDSGSLLVSGNELQAVGLLFAGSDQSTIHSPIQAVLDCLEIVI